MPKAPLAATYRLKKGYLWLSEKKQWVSPKARVPAGMVSCPAFLVVQKSPSSIATCRICGKLIQRNDYRFAWPMTDPRGIYGAISAWLHSECSNVLIPQMHAQWLKLEKLGWPDYELNEEDEEDEKREEVVKADVKEEPQLPSSLSPSSSNDLHTAEKDTQNDTPSHTPLDPPFAHNVKDEDSEDYISEMSLELWLEIYCAHWAELTHSDLELKTKLLADITKPVEKSTDLENESSKADHAVRALVPIESVPGMKCQLLNFQKEGIAWMVHQEHNVKIFGGILADEMGMGKTIQTIGCILYNRVYGTNHEIRKKLVAEGLWKYPPAHPLSEINIERRAVQEELKKKLDQEQAEELVKAEEEAKAEAAAKAEKAAKAQPGKAEAAGAASSATPPPPTPPWGKRVARVKVAVPPRVARVARVDLAMARKSALSTSDKCRVDEAPEIPQEGGTLVIAPLAAVLQWQSELSKFAPELNVLIYHGPHRALLTAELETADVVITTYPTIEADYRAVVSKHKLKCQYCGKMFLPSKLRLHLRDMCGPDAVRTARQALRERKQETTKAKAMATLHIGTEFSTAVPTVSNIYREIMHVAGRDAEAQDFSGAAWLRPARRRRAGTAHGEDAAGDPEDGADTNGTPSRATSPAATPPGATSPPLPPADTQDVSKSPLFMEEGDHGCANFSSDSSSLEIPTPFSFRDASRRSDDDTDEESRLDQLIHTPRVLDKFHELHPLGASPPDTQKSQQDEFDEEVVMPVASASSHNSQQSSEPQQVVAKPDQVVAAPTHVVENGIEVVAGPAFVVAEPDQVVSAPDQVVSALNQVVAVTDQMVAMPAEVVAAPIQVGAAPNQVVSVLTQVVAAPDQVVAAPTLQVAPSTTPLTTVLDDQMSLGSRVPPPSPVLAPHPDNYETWARTSSDSQIRKSRVDTLRAVIESLTPDSSALKKKADLVKVLLDWRSERTPPPASPPKRPRRAVSQKLKKVKSEPATELGTESVAEPLTEPLQVPVPMAEPSVGSSGPGRSLAASAPPARRASPRPWRSAKAHSPPSSDYDEVGSSSSSLTDESSSSVPVGSTSSDDSLSDLVDDDSSAEDEAPSSSISSYAETPPSKIPSGKGGKKGGTKTSGKKVKVGLAQGRHGRSQRKGGKGFQGDISSPMTDGASSSPSVDMNFVDLSSSPLHSVKWNRIVLDEAHRIKSHTTNTCKSVFALKSCGTRWCLSGTPLQNRIHELYSLLRFLQFYPYAYYFCSKKDCSCSTLNYSFESGSYCVTCGHTKMVHFSYFNRKIAKPIISYGVHGEGGLALEVLRREILNQILLRRTKVERAADVNLPPLDIFIRREELSQPEMDFYESLYKQSKTKFDTYTLAGTILHNFAHVFDLLSRLRQAVDHPYMIIHGSLASPDTPIPTHSHALTGLICGICQEDIEGNNYYKSTCDHQFDISCLTQYEKEAPNNTKLGCPVCYQTLTYTLYNKITNQPFVGDLGDEPFDDDEQLGNANAEGQATSMVETGVRNPGISSPSGSNTSLSVSDNLRLNPIIGYNRVKVPTIMSKINPREFQSSTKIEVLLQEIENSPLDSKSIVFSQFTNFLYLIDFKLKRQGVKCAVFTGSLSMESRQNIILNFNTDPDLRVILISLKAGGEGLNLQIANNIYLMDPWWNPAAEMQAIQRAHRIGQTKHVRAVRIIAKNTIEERILELQERKQLVFDGTLNNSNTAFQKLTSDDLKFLFQ